MEKIKQIKKLQIYMYLFLAGIVLEMLVEFVPIPFLAPIVSVGTFITYILIWVGFAKANSFTLKSKTLYLVLGILLTIGTLVLIGYSSMITMWTTSDLMAQGIDMLNIDAETLKQILSDQILPKYAVHGMLVQAITIILNITYGGLGLLIITANQAEINTVEQNIADNNNF